MSTFQFTAIVDEIKLGTALAHLDALGVVVTGFALVKSAADVAALREVAGLKEPLDGRLRRRTGAPRATKKQPQRAPQGVQKATKRQEKLPAERRDNAIAFLVRQMTHSHQDVVKRNVVFSWLKDNYSINSWQAIRVIKAALATNPPTLVRVGRGSYGLPTPVGRSLSNGAGTGEGATNG